MQSFFGGELPSCKVIISFIWDDASKASLPSYFPSFGWVRQEISWSYDYITLLISIVLHNFSPICHVLERWLVVLLDDLGWCKVLLMASCQDCSIILLPSLHRVSSFLEWLTTCVIRGMTEENFVYPTSLDIVGSNILWRNYHCSLLILTGYTP